MNFEKCAHIDGFIKLVYWVDLNTQVIWSADSSGKQVEKVRIKFH